MNKHATAILLATILAASLTQARAQESGDAPAKPKLDLKEIRPGIFQLGQVTFSKSARTLSFPAVVNLTESPIEYLIVTDYGKIHESVLRTRTPPVQIHAAMLLLGAKGAGKKPLPADPKQRVPGEAVTITVEMDSKGKRTKKPGESLVINRSTGKPLKKVTWIYNGSETFEGMFMAQQEGSIVSLITDAGALINYSGEGRENDDNWLPNAKALLAEETPVTVTFHLQKKPSKP